MDHNILSIDSSDQLAQIAIQGVPDGTDKLDFSPELTTIHIRVSGEGYAAEIPGDQLRTLWELQEDLYRLAAFALHGSMDIRSLTQEERKQFECRVRIEEGSWVSEIATGEFWSALFSNTLGKMSGTDIGITIGTGLLIVCGLLAWNRHEKRIEVVEAEKSSRAQTEALVTVVKSFNERSAGGEGADTVRVCVEQTGECLESTAEKLARRGHGIASIEISKKSYEGKELESLKARAKRDPEAAGSITGVFRIVAIDKSVMPWSIKVVDVFSGQEFGAKLAPDAIDGDGVQAQKDALAALADDGLVELEIALGKKRNLITSLEPNKPEEQDTES